MKISFSIVSRHFVSRNCLIFFREQKIFRKKPFHFLIFSHLQLIFRIKNSKQTVSLWFLIHFSQEHLKGSYNTAEITNFKDGLFSWKTTVPTLRDISFSTNLNDNKFFSMIQKVLKLMWWSQNSKIYKKVFLVKVLKD